MISRRRALLILCPPSLYGAVCAGAYLGEARLVFHPSREMRQWPSDAGLAREEVRLTTRDGFGLAAWFFPHEEPRATILFAHGTTGNLSTQLRRLKAMHDAGFSVLAFDYRGYGNSEGSVGDLSEEATYRDADAAWEWLAKQRAVPPSEIVVWGRSLGGGVASWLAARRAPRALVLESTYTSVVDVGADEYPWLPVRSLARIRFDTNSRLPSITCPVVVAHSRADRRIPFSHAERNFAAARFGRTFVELQGGHGTGVAGMPGAMNSIADFIAPR